MKEYIELLRDSGSGIKKELASLEVDDPLTFLWRLLSETCFGMRSWWKSRSKEGSKEAFCVDMTQLIPVCIDRCLLSRPTRKVSRPVCVDGLRRYNPDDFMEGGVENICCLFLSLWCLVTFSARSCDVDQRASTPSCQRCSDSVRQLLCDQLVVE